ncbi:MAG: hypothetical protein V7749_12205 [Cocleimonas sp.]
MSASMPVNNSNPSNLNKMIDFEKYPINVRGSDSYKELLRSVKATIEENGSVSLPNFLTKEGTDLLQQTVIDKTPEANRTRRFNNVYDMEIPEDTPEDHPLRVVLESSYSSLGRSQLRDTFIDVLYTCDYIKDFAADVLNIPQLYLHDDSYNACVVMMYQPGDKIDWHFDYGQFVCLINVQEITEGGFHECVTDVRTEDDNGFEEVGKVLNGNRSRVHQSRSSPGAFTIFKGRYSLHRVAEVKGTETRKSLVMTYEDKKGVTLTDEVRERYFYTEVDTPSN